MATTKKDLKIYIYIVLLEMIFTDLKTIIVS